MRGARGKVFLIVDNLEVHKAGKVQAWVAEHRERIELFFLPAYAPDHNPDEFLHNDLKRNCSRRVAPFGGQAAAVTAGPGGKGLPASAMARPSIADRPRARAVAITERMPANA